MSTVETWFENFFAKDEQFVLNLIVMIKRGFAVLEVDIKAANTWIINHASQITTDVQDVLGIVQGAAAAGLPIGPEIEAAATAASVAVASLNTYVNAAKSGASTTSALIAGYTAAKQAAGAHATAAIAIATAPAMPAVVAATVPAAPVAAAA